MREQGAEDAVKGIALLSEPVRRSLYEYVSASAGDVGRDEAANAVGISRALAAFHLDRLAEEGLLDVSYRRLSGRQGPGAGRPAKVYRRTGGALEVSIPARRYQALASLLANTLERVGARGARALREAARDLGADIGRSARPEGGDGAGAEVVQTVLADNGFEPVRTDADTVELRNCPFEAVAREYTDLVCGANVAFMEGVLHGAQADGLAVALEPQDGRCCAVFRRVDAGDRNHPTDG